MNDCVSTPSDVAAQQRLVRAAAGMALSLAALCCSSEPHGEVGVFTAPDHETADAEASPATTSSAAPSPASSYDPNIVFDWPEAKAQSGNCLAGQYVGQFSCEMDPGGALPSGLVTGPVSFTLQESLAGEFLEITTGALSGLAGLVQFQSTLDGKLDCTTDSFHAVCIDGMYFGGTFSGTLEGSLDRATQTLSGTWAMATAGVPPCIGQWSVVHTP